MVLEWGAFLLGDMMPEVTQLVMLGEQIAILH